MKRVLSVQDLSCVGGCSLAAALPVLSACGVGACALPTAVLSTHTGFPAPEIQDFSREIPAICGHWRRAGIAFDGITIGYLGKPQVAELLPQWLPGMLTPGGRVLIDPVMGDHGKLYAGLDGGYVDAMRKLCRRGNLLTPNLTELCLLSGEKPDACPTGGEVRRMMAALREKTQADVLLTGWGEAPEQTGFALLEGDCFRVYSRPRLPGAYPGTGDLFAATLMGAWMGGREIYDAGGIAAEFVAAAMEATPGDADARFGADYAKALPELLRRLER